MKNNKSHKRPSFVLFAFVSAIVLIFTVIYSNITAPPASCGNISDTPIATASPVSTPDTEYTYYINNNEKVCDKPASFSGDVHKVIYKGGTTYYTNFPMGYSLEIPAKTEFNLDRSKILTVGRIGDEPIDFTITREYSPYDDVIKYVAEYTNRFMMDPRFIEENNITMHRDEIKDVGKYRVQYIIFTRNAPENSLHMKNTYAHCYIYTDNRTYFRMTFNTHEYTDGFSAMTDRVTESFREIDMQGEAGFYLNFEPVIPDYWNEETRLTYENLAGRSTPAWGIFCPQSVKDDKLYKINNVEEKIGNRFNAALDYMYFGEEVPIKGMQTAYDQGKLVELTMQISTVMHLNLNGYNPFFEVLDGTRDDYIRQIARELRDFGHPFMFRLNNEMNTDWTSYGGACILNEPELFKEVWIHMYKIFREEGVDNAMWIFNPNDRNCPPNEYNHFVNYYPGNEYVHIYGITGYNTGTYYAEVFGETWREFEEIYDAVYEKCEPYFGKFPWIITEFSSSSVGGDKVDWINNMFSVLPKYKNLKLAIWFCSVDYDFRYAIEDNIIARPYLLDETDETVRAFSNGLKNSGYTPDSLFGKE